MWVVAVAFGASVGGCALTSCEDKVDESALGAAEADSLEQASEIADLPTLLPGSEWRVAHSWQRSGNTWLKNISHSICLQNAREMALVLQNPHNFGDLCIKIL